MLLKIWFFWKLWDFEIFAIFEFFENFENLVFKNYAQYQLVNAQHQFLSCPTCWASMHNKLCIDLPCTTLRCASLHVSMHHASFHVHYPPPLSGVKLLYWISGCQQLNSNLGSTHVGVALLLKLKQFCLGLFYLFTFS